MKKMFRMGCSCQTMVHLFPRDKSNERTSTEAGTHRTARYTTGIGHRVAYRRTVTRIRSFVISGWWVTNGEEHICDNLSLSTSSTRRDLSYVATKGRPTIFHIKRPLSWTDWFEAATNLRVSF